MSREGNEHTPPSLQPLRRSCLPKKRRPPTAPPPGTPSRTRSRKLRCNKKLYDYVSAEGEAHAVFKAKGLASEEDYIKSLDVIICSLEQEQEQELEFTVSNDLEAEFKVSPQEKIRNIFAEILNKKNGQSLKLVMALLNHFVEDKLSAICQAIQALIVVKDAVLPDACTVAQSRTAFVNALKQQNEHRNLKNIKGSLIGEMSLLGILWKLGFMVEQPEYQYALKKLMHDLVTSSFLKITVFNRHSRPPRFVLTTSECDDVLDFQRPVDRHRLKAAMVLFLCVRQRCGNIESKSAYSIAVQPRVTFRLVFQLLKAKPRDEEAVDSSCSELSSDDTSSVGDASSAGDGSDLEAGAEEEAFQARWAF